MCILIYSNILMCTHNISQEKNYDTDRKLKHFCPNDGWVAFRNSELVSGNIAKKTIGDGSKTGLLYVLLRDCGPEYAARFMDRFSKLCSRYFGMHRGFSIGISDVAPSEKLKKMKHDILSQGYNKVSHDKYSHLLLSMNDLLTITCIMAWYSGRGSSQKV